jgi:AraC family transcriptional regulator
VALLSGPKSSRPNESNRRASGKIPAFQRQNNLMIRTFSGASVRRVIDRSDANVPEHAHDWPVLSIYVIGGYTNQTECAKTLIAGPSAILYQAGAAHCNEIGPTGFEQIEIEFDPDWLGCALIPDSPVSRWIGGRAGAESRTLGQFCTFVASEERLRAAVRQFVQRASSEPQLKTPSWVQLISRRLQENTALGVNDLAQEVRRHPSWLGSAYRRATGEGLLETAARLRVERAACLLRESDQTGADIAQEAGFCDQSHMSRTFRRVLGRLPSAVRDDRATFRQQSTDMQALQTSRRKIGA